ncbi:hypothetical protein F5884DRAFT_883679 [Xylogone sp. PMI_703]|nr:hypothetical protein F5884DRAFT_883679 [Xylogone sp. PMI_703]
MSNKVIGGHGGTAFYYERVGSGAVVKEITVWKDDGALRAIRVVLSDTSVKEAGKTVGESKTFAFKQGEKCAQLSLWGNGIGTRCGRIRIYTTEGRDFDWGMHGGQEEFSMNVGSGILAGFHGRSGSDIDCLGPLFLKPIRSIISTVKYGQLPSGKKGIKSVELDSFRQTNGSSSNDLNWSWKKSVSKTTSQSWSQSATSTFGLSISIEAKIPEVATIGTEASWQLSNESSHSESKTQTKELSWEESGTLKPGDSLNLTAITKEGKINKLPYTSTVEIVFRDGSKFSYDENGDYNRVSYSHVDISVSN